MRFKVKFAKMTTKTQETCYVRVIMRWKMWLSQISRLNLKFFFQLENTFIQFIPTSIDINDLIDEYAGVNKRKNRQNRRDDNYIEKELINQNRQS